VSPGGHEYDGQMLDVRRLRVLRAVAVRGSISAAAESLDYTPSAVSQQIFTLEREIGIALVERGPRSVTLTDAGRALAEHAEVILQRLELAETEVLAIAGLKGGRLRMATFRSVGETVAADAIQTFSSRHPLVDLTLAEGEPEEYLGRVGGGEFDLGLTFEYDTVPMPQAGGLDYALLFREPMDIAVPVGHSAAGGDGLDLGMLADDAWVASTPMSSVHAFTYNVCRRAGFEPRVAFETNDYRVAQALVASGAGVTFLPRLLVHNLNPGVVALPVLGDSPMRNVLAAYRTGGERAPAVAAMLDILHELAAGS
jgi:DNA-binding transcriptional LysR family regulator